jgi:hypothetical protein
MRSRRAGLRRVARQFGVWRRRREGRRIPTELWDAAVGLLAEHSSSEICRAPRLNATRFKEAQEARKKQKLEDTAAYLVRNPSRSGSSSTSTARRPSSTARG